MKKVTVFVLLLCSIGVWSCGSKRMPEHLLSKIPNNANAIELYSTEDSEEFYELIFKKLDDLGFEIEHSYDEQKKITTEFRAIDSETTLKIHVFVKDTRHGSVAQFDGKWSSDSFTNAIFNGNKGGGSTAKWSRGASKDAYGAMAVVADKIEHASIQFL